MEQRLRERARRQLITAMRQILEEKALRAAGDRIDAAAERVYERLIDPRTAAEGLLDP